MTTVSSVTEPTLPVDTATSKVLFTGVVDIQGITKGELFDRFSVWFAKTYVSSKEVIQLQSRESGTIIGKGAIPVTVTFPPLGLVAGLYGETPYGVVYYTISVYMKDEKYKYEITDFIHEGNVKGTDVSMGRIEGWRQSKIGPDAQKEIRIQTKQKVDELVAAMQRFVANAGSQSDF
jgi:hypothetical protein